MCIYMCVYIYIYTHTYGHIYISIYIYTYILWIVYHGKVISRMHEQTCQIQPGSLPVFQGGAQFMTVAIEALGPHRCCGGRDIACAICFERGRSWIWVWPPFHLVSSAWTSHWPIVADLSGEKRVLRQGRGLELEATNSEPFALVAEPRCR